MSEGLRERKKRETRLRISDVEVEVVDRGDRARIVLAQTAGLQHGDRKTE